MENIPIFMLHGLGSHPITFLPMEIYLKWKGFSKIYKILYPVDSFSTIQESVDYVSNEINKIVEENERIIVIGQSMGGVIANRLHQYHNIEKTIMIGAPLHGANLLNQLESILPKFVVDYFNKNPYDILKQKDREEEPPHDYNTISMGWFNTEFDGCVYKNEAILDPNKNTHLKWADHRSIFANPRLFKCVYNLIIS